MKAKNPTIVKVGSHSVSMDYGTKVTKEELFPYMTVEWNGATIEVTVEANRYVHSSGWSEWRIFANRNYSRNALTETATRAVNEACRPLVEAWINSPAYKASRQRAFFNMIARQLKDERYSADRPAELLAAHSHELNASDRAKLNRAVKHLRAFLATFED